MKIDYVAAAKRDGIEEVLITAVAEEEPGHQEISQTYQLYQRACKL